MATSKTKKRAAGSSAVPQFVLLSDLHAHAWTAFARGDGRENSRLQRSLTVLAASLEKARELGVPWAFAGDIVHTAGYTLNVVLSELVDRLCRYNDVVKLAVWGNHDARGVGGRITLEQTVLSALHRAVPQFYVLDPSVLVRYEDPKTGLSFSGAGYQPHKSLLEYGEPADVGVYHQTVQGTKTAHGFRLEEGVEAEEMLKRHRLSVVGHVHHWQWPDDEHRILVPGSPEHHNFGDSGEHGWWVVSVPKKGAPTMEMVAGGSPEFRTVATPKEVKKDGNFYRVLLTPDGVTAPKGAVMIAPSPTVIENRDVLRGARGAQTLDVWLQTEPPVTELPLEQYAAIGRSLLGPFELSNLQPYRLEKIHLKNFCSYADQAFTVNPGTWLVVGKGKDFPSNGAGKSTLFEAVYWLLFGNTTKGLSGDEVIRWGTENCEVTAEFGDGQGGWLRVTRARGDGSTLEVEGCAAMSEAKWTLEGKSVNEITAKLGQHLGLTEALFQALAYFSQEKLLLFASSTDGERKDMLADLIGLSAYQEAASAAQRRIAELEVVVGRLEGHGESLVSQLESERERLASTTTASADWLEDRDARAEVARQAVVLFDRALPKEKRCLLDAARKELGSSLAQRRREAEQALAEAEARLDEQTRNLVTSTPEELEEAQQAASDAVSEVKRIREAVEGAQIREQNLTRRLADWQAKLASGKCPTCSQKITATHRETCLAPVRADLEAAQQERLALIEEQKVAGDRAVTLQRTANTTRIQAKNLIAIEATQSAVVDAREQLTALDADEKDVEKAAGRHVEKVLVTTRKDLDAAVQRILAERNPHAAEESGTQARIAQAEKALKKQEADLKGTRDEIDILEYWRHGFSKQGIQSLLVDEVAGLFNDARGSIFPALTQGVYDVQFSTCSQTKTGEWRERTEFQVYERGELVPYSALSGGQRRRVDVGVMLTLVKAVSSWMQVPGILGFLVLDEVFGFLDGSGAEGLMEALREVQQVIPSIYVVSHEPQLQALFPQVVAIEQGADGVSRILNEEVDE